LSIDYFFAALEIESDSYSHSLSFLFYALTVILKRSAIFIKCYFPTEKRFSQFINFQDQIDVYFCGIKSFFEDSSFLASFALDSEQSETIECCGVGIKSDLYVPFRHVYIPFCFSVSSVLAITKSTIGTLSPKIRVIDDLDFQLNLIPIDNIQNCLPSPVQAICVPAKFDLNVLYSSKTCSFSITLDFYSNQIYVTFEAPIHCTEVFISEKDRIPLFLEIEVISHEYGFVAKFNKATIPQPIMINNSLSSLIFVIDPDQKNKYHIYPGTTSIYALSKPYAGEIVQIEIEGAVF
jgi:hypothetical protein